MGNGVSAGFLGDLFVSTLPRSTHLGHYIGLNFALRSFCLIKFWIRNEPNGVGHGVRVKSEGNCSLTDGPYPNRRSWPIKCRLYLDDSVRSQRNRFTADRHRFLLH